jgi:hypothetical protein
MNRDVETALLKVETAAREQLDDHEDTCAECEHGECDVARDLRLAFVQLDLTRSRAA